MTLGTISFQFNRAINWLSVLIESGVISESVFLQHGSSDASRLAGHPLVTLEPTVNGRKMTELVGNSRLVISHAGQGSTRMLAAKGCSFILIPRLNKYSEHVDNHQLLFAQAVENFGIKSCLSLEELKSAVLQPPPIFQGQIFQNPKLTEHLLQLYPPEHKKVEQQQTLNSNVIELL
ncbi:MAG: glycosyltransferase [Cyanobacteria bacterium J06639_18]